MLLYVLIYNHYNHNFINGNFKLICKCIVLLQVIWIQPTGYRINNSIINKIQNILGWQTVSTHYSESFNLYNDRMSLNSNLSNLTPSIITVTHSKLTIQLSDIHLRLFNFWKYLTKLKQFQIIPFSCILKNGEKTSFCSLLYTAFY